MNKYSIYLCSRILGEKLNNEFLDILRKASGYDNNEV